MTRKIINLAIGKPKEYNWNNRKEVSGIGKSAVQAFKVEKLGIVDDDVANHKFHGGPDRVVCMYPFEHYSYWEEEFQRKLILPAFGENITAAGMTEEQVCIGDIFKIGDTILQVTQGRVPCVTISNYNEEKGFLKKVIDTTLTGYFFRVLEEGTIMLDSEITLLEKHEKEISVSFATQILFHQKQDKASIEKILTVDALAEEWRNRFLKLL
ncbi:MOSC domain-containing protein YiiM [Lysinibacillus composti]|uniref:MOSC domain-containing protein n=1 Tax=Lysinibacillus composti TaxID=720633 RepID=A0A3N9UD02_9BACI|nr:MOSC domain-containing protein [Lysinibacillus composti]MBM7609163.1 MOSC domain-containing protein YiiM [Lysinibacillus composti]RQW74214.1 MOSC domain-containing protein [Lysinibacillus composti]